MPHAKLHLRHSGSGSSGSAAVNNSGITIYGNRSLLNFADVALRPTASTVSITLTNYTLSQGWYPTPGAKVFQYMQINGTVNGALLDNIDQYVTNVTYNFSIPISWVQQQHITDGNIRLMKYYPSIGQWVGLPTAWSGSNITSYFYTAQSNTLSTYAVVVSTAANAVATTSPLPVTVTSGFESYFYAAADQLTAPARATVNFIASNQVGNSVSAAYGGNVFVGSNEVSLNIGLVNTPADAADLVIQGVGANVLAPTNTLAQITGSHQGLGATGNVFVTGNSMRAQFTTNTVVNFNTLTPNSVAFLVAAENVSFNAVTTPSGDCTPLGTDHEGSHAYVFVANCILPTTGAYTFNVWPTNNAIIAMAAYVFAEYTVWLNDNPSVGNVLSVACNGCTSPFNQINGNTINVVGDGVVNAIIPSIPGIPGVLSFMSWSADTKNTVNVIIDAQTANTQISVMGNVILTATYGKFPTLIANAPVPEITNSIIDVGQYTTVNTIIVNGISPYQGNWIWYPPNSLSSPSASNTAFEQLLTGGTSNSVITVNAWSPSNMIFSFNSVSFNANVASGGAIGLWTFSGNNYYDAGSNALLSLSNVLFVVNNAPSITSLTATNTLIDQNQYQTLKAAVSGGTPPFTYNFLVYNSVGSLVFNGLFNPSYDTPSVDGTNDIPFTSSSGSSFTDTLTTTNAGDVIMLFFAQAGGSCQPSVSDGDSLTWHNRYGQAAAKEYEEFYATSTVALSKDVITVTCTSGSITEYGIVAFGLNDVLLFTPVFDPNPNLPQVSASTSAVTTANTFVTTSVPHDILITFVGGSHPTTITATAPSGFTAITGTVAGNWVNVAYKVVTAAQANTVAAWTFSSTGDEYTGWGDAFMTAAASTNTFTYQQTALPAGANAFTYNLIVTDSASVPVTVNSPNFIYGANTALGTPSIAPLTGSNQLIGNTLQFTATLPSTNIGTGPYTYNYILVNVITGHQTGNMLFLGVPGTSNSFTYTFLTSDGGQNEEANVMVTDSATTNMITNSIYSGTVNVIPNTCIPIISNTLIAFPNEPAGQSAPTANVVNVMNVGNAASNILVFGTNWIAAPTIGNFLVGNTLWNGIAPSTLAIGNQLSSTAVDTQLLMVANGGSNVIFFGLNTPAGQPEGTYNQVITIETSC